MQCKRWVKRSRSYRRSRSPQKSVRAIKTQGGTRQQIHNQMINKCYPSHWLTVSGCWRQQQHDRCVIRCSITQANFSLLHTWIISVLPCWLACGGLDNTSGLLWTLEKVEGETNNAGQPNLQGSPMLRKECNTSKTEGRKARCQDVPCFRAGGRTRCQSRIGGGEAPTGQLWVRNISEQWMTERTKKQHEVAVGCMWGGQKFS